MKRRVVIIVLAAAVAVAGLAAWALWPRGGPEVISGHVEGEPLYLSAAAPGVVRILSVERGDRVAAGAALFQIDPDTAQAQTAQADAAAAARAVARDAAKGQRPAELAVIRAARQSARAQLDKAQIDFARTQTLVRQGVYAPAMLDQARAALAVAQAGFDQASRQLDVAELGARTDQREAAQARSRQAEAAVAEAAHRQSLLAPAAPADALVEDVFYRPGEWAAANQPVVELLPDARVKIRFFVPETALAAYRPGRKVRFTCDGCTAQSATITYVSPRAEFTPPVLYNRDQRKRLVFLVEAIPQSPRALSPGQPVDVTPLAPEPGR